MPFLLHNAYSPKTCQFIIPLFSGGLFAFFSIGFTKNLCNNGSPILWIFNPLLIILQVGHNTKAEAIGYFPFVLAGLLLLLQNKRLMGWLLSTLALGMQIRANHYQMTYYLLFLLFIFGLVYFWEAFKKKDVNNFLIR